MNAIFVIGGILSFGYIAAVLIVRSQNKALIARRLGKFSEQSPCVWADDTRPWDVIRDARQKTGDGRAGRASRYAVTGHNTHDKGAQ